MERKVALAIGITRTRLLQVHEDSDKEIDGAI